VVPSGALRGTISLPERKETIIKTTHSSSRATAYSALHSQLGPAFGEIPHDHTENVIREFTRAWCKAGKSASMYEFAGHWQRTSGHTWRNASDRAAAMLTSLKTFPPRIK
jgi:hypothetical protein